MNCKQYQEQAIEIAFGEAERTKGFDLHLESCKACREEFAAYAFAAKGIEDVPAPPAPSLSNERLYSAIRAQNIRRSSPWLPRLAFAGAAASVAFAAWIGFNRPTIEPIPYVASVSEHRDTAPAGPIEITESTPAIKATVADIVAERTAPTRRVRGGSSPQPNKRTSATSVVEEIPDELLAVVVGGAEGALDFAPETVARGGAAMMEAPAPAGSPDSPIVVIQPQGQATEKSSDDVSIGG